MLKMKKLHPGVLTTEPRWGGQSRGEAELLVPGWDPRGPSLMPDQQRASRGKHQSFPFHVLLSHVNGRCKGLVRSHYFGN